MVCFEKARVVREYRTPYGLTFISMLCINVGTAFLGPYFVSLCLTWCDDGVDPTECARYGCFFTLVIGNLYRVQRGMVRLLPHAAVLSAPPPPL